MSLFQVSQSTRFQVLKILRNAKQKAEYNFFFHFMLIWTSLRYLLGLSICQQKKPLFATFRPFCELAKSLSWQQTKTNESKKLSFIHPHSWFIWIFFFIKKFFLTWDTLFICLGSLCRRYYNWVMNNVAIYVHKMVLRATRSTSFILRLYFWKLQIQEN